MKMVIPNEGKVAWLDWAMGNGVVLREDYVLSLYQNNYTPVDGSTGTDFTDSTFPGYADVDIDQTDMGAAAVVANVAVSECNFVPVFTCTGGAGELAYGWYLAGRTSGLVLAAQRFDVARNMTSGATESIDPFTISLKTFT